MDARQEVYAGTLGAAELAQKLNTNGRALKTRPPYRNPRNCGQYCVAVSISIVTPGPMVELTDAFFR